VGILLLVALVVILAAFLAAGTFGLIGPGMATKNVALVASPGNLTSSGPTAVITVHGGRDLDLMTHLEYTLDNAVTWGNVTDLAGNDLVPGSNYPLQVGQVVATGNNGPEGKRLMLRGTFGDGSVQILYDKQF
jgi:hypothetical protein